MFSVGYFRLVVEVNHECVLSCGSVYVTRWMCEIVRGRTCVWVCAEAFGIGRHWERGHVFWSERWFFVLLSSPRLLLLVDISNVPCLPCLILRIDPFISPYSHYRPWPRNVCATTVSFPFVLVSRVKLALHALFKRGTGSFHRFPSPIPKRRPKDV